MENANQAYRGNIASNYEKDRVVEEIWGKEQKFIRDYLTKIDSGSTIFDVPVGTGRFIDLYLERGLDVIGVDISDDMLSEARKKFGDNGKVKLEKGDVKALNHPNVSIDYVICWRLVHLLSSADLDSMLAEFSRIAKKEIIIQTYDKLRAPTPNLGVIIFRKLFNIISKLLKRPKGDNLSAWSDIKNFTHSDSEINELFNKNNLVVKQTFILEDSLNQEKIYVLSKIV